MWLGQSRATAATQTQHYTQIRPQASTDNNLIRLRAKTQKPTTTDTQSDSSYGSVKGNPPCRSGLVKAAVGSETQAIIWRVENEALAVVGETLGARLEQSVRLAGFALNRGGLVVDEIEGEATWDWKDTERKLNLAHWPHLPTIRPKALTSTPTRQTLPRTRFAETVTQIRLSTSPASLRLPTRLNHSPNRLLTKPTLSTVPIPPTVSRPAHKHHSWSTKLDHCSPIQASWGGTVTGSVELIVSRWAEPLPRTRANSGTQLGLDLAIERVTLKSPGKEQELQAGVPRDEDWESRAWEEPSTQQREQEADVGGLPKVESLSARSKKGAGATVSRHLKVVWVGERSLCGIRAVCLLAGWKLITQTCC